MSGHSSEVEHQPSKLGVAGSIPAVRSTDFLTLYCVLNARNTALALVVAKNGADAIQVCIEDGLDWAMKNCQVRRIHKRVSETRGRLSIQRRNLRSPNMKQIWWLYWTEEKKWHWKKDPPCVVGLRAHRMTQDLSEALR